MRFKAFSMEHPDFNYVYREGRERGVPRGDVVYVFGYNMKVATDRLRDIRSTFEENKCFIMSEVRMYSFRVEPI